MIDYCKIGDGKRNLVILPGLSVKSTIQFKDEIAKRYEEFKDYSIYIMDDRQKVKEGYTLKDRAEDVAELMQELGIKDAYVFGVSMGGMESHYLAAYHPELVKKLVNASTCAKLSDSMKNRMDKWISLCGKEKILVLLLQMLTDIYSKQTIKESGEAIVKTYLDASEEEINKFRILCKAIRDNDSTNELSMIKCPMIIFASKGDLLFNEKAAVDIVEKTGAKLYVYDNSFGHALYDEDPDFASKIKLFFEND